MKKIIYIFLAVSVALSLFSCNKVDIADQTTYIGFNFLKTKAPLINDKATYVDSRVSDGKFQLTVYDSETDPNTVVISTQDASYNTTSEKWETVHPYAWPVKTGNVLKSLLFYSWTPKAEGQSDITFNQLTGKASFSYTAQTDTTKQRDIMFGYYSGVGLNGVGTLSYSHALAAVKFKVGTIPAGTTINSLTLSGLVDSGSCEYVFSTDSYTWTGNSTAGTNVYFPTDNDETAGYGTLSTGDQIGKDAITLVPQTIPDGATISLNVTPSGGTATTLTYEIDGKSLQRGKVSVFTLNMTSTISFDLSVVAWIPVGPENIDLN